MQRSRDREKAQRIAAPNSHRPSRVGVHRNSDALMEHAQPQDGRSPLATQSNTNTTSNPTRLSLSCKFVIWSRVVLCPNCICVEYAPQQQGRPSELAEAIVQGRTVKPGYPGATVTDRTSASFSPCWCCFRRFRHDPSGLHQKQTPEQQRANSLARHCESKARQPTRGH